MSLPVQFFVTTGAENVDVGFGLLAQPNLRALDRSDDTRQSEATEPAAMIATLDAETPAPPAARRIKTAHDWISIASTRSG